MSTTESAFKSGVKTGKIADFLNRRQHELDIKGVKRGWHCLRHSFAAAYIRDGGDVFSLQRMLGHARLELSRRYVNLQTEDLQQKHSKHARLLAGTK